MGIYVTNLKQQLRDLADKQCERNTNQLCEALRKAAFDRAASGYSTLVYTIDIPFNWMSLKAYFSTQEIKVDTMDNSIRLSW
jgi:hypothetical protein